MRNGRVAGVRSSSLVAPEGVRSGTVEFLDRAELLLSQSLMVPAAEKLELSYQAALRVAGAVQAQRPARKRTVDKGAWARLRRVAPEYGEWADRFEGFHPIRERVRIGLDRSPDPAIVAEINRSARDFVALVESDLGMLQAAA